MNLEVFRIIREFGAKHQALSQEFVKNQNLAALINGQTVAAIDAAKAIEAVYAGTRLERTSATEREPETASQVNARQEAAMVAANVHQRDHEDSRDHEMHTFPKGRWT